ncbi:Crp/Fnr family transcriptional regulator [Priestia taiwanensis]|uniref:Crp/Fnr family transcriptional regulator n=1 Tax=Priestia taiwanensis TaxID=1347902 RepID=A0A917AQH2_9BACI|nr:Crp/Fnr family transcriptional regulator [Priestia taiwanensis]MBM7363154.1 CRP/FNR family transcriptional regulator [Priestia taiwanensis]GGE68135.1 Crp/Fnr family transcriptional regulator [Priestia taiwanensis]
MQCLQCNKKYCLSFVPIFQQLKTEEIMELSHIVTHKTYKKGEVIFLAGDVNNHLFVVHKGTVKITHISEDGREQVVRIIQAGDFFGELSLFRSSPLNSNAEAIELTEVCILQGHTFKDILTNIPSLQFNMLNQLSERLEKAEFQLSQLSNQDVGQRLATFLLQCSQNSGNEAFELPINKTDAASMLGTSRETLSRKLSFFQRKGYITVSARQIRICNRNALQALLS